MYKSKYFTEFEMTYSSEAKKRGINNIPNEEQLNNIHQLMELMDVIRNKWGSPIKITSGFRSVELNDVTKGSSKTSQHMCGAACDFKPYNNQTQKLFKLIEEMLKLGEIQVGQLIDEYNYSWIHISLPRLKKNNQIKHIK